MSVGPGGPTLSTWDFHHLRGASRGKPRDTKESLEVTLSESTLDLSLTSKHEPDDRCMIGAHEMMRASGRVKKTFEPLAPKLEQNQHDTLKLIYTGHQPAGAKASVSSPKASPFVLTEVWPHQYKDTGQLPSVMRTRAEYYAHHTLTTLSRLAVCACTDAPTQRAPT